MTFWLRGLRRLLGIRDDVPHSPPRALVRKSRYHNARGNGSYDNPSSPPHYKPVYALIIRLALEHRVIRQTLKDIQRFRARRQAQ